MKHINHILICFLLCCSHAALAQSWTWAWTESSTGRLSGGYTVATDASGNVYAGVNAYAGLTTVNFGALSIPFLSSSAYEEQAVWVKYNSAGTPLWADAAQAGNSWLISVTTDPGGNLIVFGGFASPSITIGGTTLTNAFGSASAASYSLQNMKYFIAKYSPTGTPLWAIADGDCHALNEGIWPGIYCTGGGVATDTAGNIYITSSFQRATISIGANTLTNTDPSGATDDIFVAKYDPSGTVLWAKSLGGVLNDYAFGITVPPSGGAYITGCFFSPSIAVGSTTLVNPYASPALEWDYAIVARFSSAGVPLWGMSGNSREGSYGMSIASDATGNVYVVGAFGDTTMSAGSTILTRTYPPNYFVGGYNALFLLKISPANSVLWGKTISSVEKDVFGFGVAVSCSNVWVSGTYADTLDVDGHTIPFTPLSVSNVYNLVLAGYDMSSGSLVNYTAPIRYAGGSPAGVYLAGDNLGNLYACSVYDDSLDLGRDTTRGYGGYYMFTARYAISGSDSTYIHNDTTICGAMGVTLTAPASFSTYIWNDGSSHQSLTVSDTGTYWAVCTSTACGTQLLADTFHVTLGIADTAAATTDTAFCLSQPAIISAPIGYTTYQWSNGSTGDSIAVSASGSFFVMAQAGCNTVIDTFDITAYPLPPVSIVTDSSGCNDFVLTSHQPPSNTYLWSNNTTGSSMAVTTPGAYWLTVTDPNGCTAADTVNIAQTPSGHALITNVTPSQTIPYGTTVQLNADNEVIYMWKPDDGTLSNPNINNPVASPFATTVYTVYGYDHHGCIDSASVIISVDSSMHECIPSAFTPNHDGLNDIFRPACIRFQSLADFRVFNRWGQMVFYSNDYEKGWDGTFNGVPQDAGVYYYYMIVARPGSTDIIYKGDVTLLR